MTSSQQFQRLPATARTQKQVKILAAVKSEDQYVLIGRLVDTEWREAVRMGLVNEAALDDVTLPAGLTELDLEKSKNPADGDHGRRKVTYEQSKQE